ncbi:nuclear transport factor 2 family protein [Serinibacter salmoneus]|uniref:SnoaL-like protein n=1 Tax=Serinibacter salmoneus TaxID=556530 RepID=A0A2A9CWN6_9MICO|nr:nuclear transport factor 2 family protein [Serinibacter salmoneus]PFG18847.1 SnoaL-like protein [Serinibacter salmoneus]
MTTAPSPIAEFIDAVNRHDEEAFLDAFTTEGFVDDWGRIFTGREAIKGWSDKEFIGAVGTLTVTEVAEEGDRIVVTGDWRSNHANGLSIFSFETQGDQIASMTIRAGH